MIDWKRVSALRHEVGEDEFRPLVELFLDEIEGAIMGIVPGDPDSLRQALHFMKGCALNMGLRAFCQNCDTWGALVAAGRARDLRVASLMEAYAVSKQVLMHDLDRMTLGQAPEGGVA